MSENMVDQSGVKKEETSTIILSDDNGTQLTEIFLEYPDGTRVLRKLQTEIPWEIR